MTKSKPFASKNRLRKENYTGSQEHRTARDLRRAVGGAFGHADPDFHNKLVPGTSGTHRVAVPKN